MMGPELPFILTAPLDGAAFPFPYPPFQNVLVKHKQFSIFTSFNFGINMTEELEDRIKQAEDQMKNGIRHLEVELTRIRAGKASPMILDGIVVDYYGSPTPLNQVANITIPDARTIALQPWEKSMMAPIEKAIMAANIGLNPQNDGTMIKLYLPPLTEERRKELVKKVNLEGENAKIAIRNVRRDVMEKVKKEQKEGLSEDAAKDLEGRIQAMTDRQIQVVDQLCKEKEKEIMTI